MKTGDEVLCFDCRTNHPFLMKQEYCQLSSVSKTDATRTSTLSNLISQGFILCIAVLYFQFPLFSEYCDVYVGLGKYVTKSAHGRFCFCQFPISDDTGTVHKF